MYASSTYALVLVMHVCVLQDADMSPLDSLAPSAAPLKRQSSVKPPPMESIVEELDISLEESKGDSLTLTGSQVCV